MFECWNVGMCIIVLPKFLDWFSNLCVRVRACLSVQHLSANRTLLNCSLVTAPYFKPTSHASFKGAWSFPDCLELGVAGEGTFTWNEAQTVLALFAITSSRWKPHQFIEPFAGMCSRGHLRGSTFFAPGLVQPISVCSRRLATLFLLAFTQYCIGVCACVFVRIVIIHSKNRLTALLTLNHTAPYYDVVTILPSFKGPLILGNDPRYVLQRLWNVLLLDVLK